MNVLGIFRLQIDPIYGMVNDNRVDTGQKTGVLYSNITGVITVGTLHHHINGLNELAKHTELDTSKRDPSCNSF